MKTGPFITSVEYTAYEFTAHNLGKDYNTFNMVYEPDGPADPIRRDHSDPHRSRHHRRISDRRRPHP